MTIKTGVVHKAVIYPAGTVSGYGHIFSLGLAGIPVVALNPVRCANFKSRFVREKYIVPNPVDNYRLFIEWLTDYGKKQPVPPVLFLAEDLYAFIVSVHQEQLSGYYLYPYIELERINTFFDKEPMLRAAAGAGLHVPDTIFPAGAGEIDVPPAFPVVLKPRVSRFTFKDHELADVVKFPSVFGGKAVQVNNPEELAVTVRRLKAENIDFLIQRLIPGENSNLVNIKFVAAADYRIPSYFISRKIRQYPADFGTCTVARAELIPGLQEYAERFCRFTKYVGPAGMEFKKNPADGKWYFIEINPRLDFWIRMSTLKGVNLPLQQYLLSTGQRMFTRAQNSDGKHWIDVKGDFKGYKWRKANKKWPISFFQFIKAYVSFNEAVLNIKDPRPGLTEVFLKNLPFLKPAGKAWAWIRNCRRAWHYMSSQKAPLTGYRDYAEYWGRRKKLGHDRVIYPRYVMALAHIKKDDRVLDYGCGSGEFIRWLGHHGYNSLGGTDVYRSPEFPAGAVFYPVDELPGQLRFDVVTLLQVAEHVQDAEELISQLLTITNTLVVSVPNTGYWQHRMRLLLGRFPVTDVVLHMKEHLRFWTQKDFIDMCRYHGWKIKSVQATEPPRGVLARRLPGLFARQIMYVLTNA